jgi:hypothetical protein
MSWTRVFGIGRGSAQHARQNAGCDGYRDYRSGRKVVGANGGETLASDLVFSFDIPIAVARMLRIR